MPVRACQRFDKYEAERRVKRRRDIDEEDKGDETEGNNRGRISDLEGRDL